ncbi:hypothetical protein BaRGS_00012094 [Batillaria attramentaria]|uniref:Uncharacterized protein n=1 Tax=Batillaria attramentaria TaxID=370345 RepID=A0ABD0LBD6_9CAEN
MEVHRVSRSRNSQFSRKTKFHMYNQKQQLEFPSCCTWTQKSNITEITEPFASDARLKVTGLLSVSRANSFHHKVQGTTELSFSGTVVEVHVHLTDTDSGNDECDSLER